MKLEDGHIDEHRRAFKEAVKSRMSEQSSDIELMAENGFTLSVRCGNSELQVDLENTYINYRNGLDDLDHLIRKFLDGIRENANLEVFSWEKAAPRLLPSIKAQDYFSNVSDSYYEKLLIFDYLYGLKIGICIDSPSSMRYITKEEAQKWGVESRQIILRAIANLPALYAEEWATALNKATQEGMFDLSSGKGYDSSLILLPNFRSDICRALGCKNMAAAIPCRDVIMAVGIDDTRYAVALSNVATDLFGKRAYATTPELIFFPDGNGGRPAEGAVKASRTG